METEENGGKNGVKQKIKPLHMLGYMSRAFFSAFALLRS